MKHQAWDLFGCALQDYCNGERDRVVLAVREDGFIQEMPVAGFFDTPALLPRLHTIAMQACRGHVLDVGAGAGRHSRFLQAKGYRVTAIDISPQSVSVMQRLGIVDSQTSDIRLRQPEAYDTLLFLMNGIGTLGTCAELQRFLTEFDQRIYPGGQIILDSWDFRKNNDSVHRRYYCQPFAGRAYVGETHYRIHYCDRGSIEVSWLFIDPQTLVALATSVGLCCDILAQQTDGTYVARLYR